MKPLTQYQIQLHSMAQVFEAQGLMYLARAARSVLMDSIKEHQS